jgi:hypothetical protein
VKSGQLTAASLNAPDSVPKGTVGTSREQFSHIRRTMQAEGRRAAEMGVPHSLPGDVIRFHRPPCAKALGLAIPANLLALAGEVIE